MLDLKKSFEVTRYAYNRRIFFKILRGCILGISSLIFLTKSWSKRTKILNVEQMSTKYWRGSIERNLISIIRAAVILYEAYELHYLFKPNHTNVIIKMLVEDLKRKNILDKTSIEAFEKFANIK